MDTPAAVDPHNCFPSGGTLPGKVVWFMSPLWSRPPKGSLPRSAFSLACCSPDWILIWHYILWSDIRLVGIHVVLLFVRTPCNVFDSTWTTYRITSLWLRRVSHLICILTVEHFSRSIRNKTLRSLYRGLHGLVWWGWMLRDRLLLEARHRTRPKIRLILIRIR